jgi:hypothetical protein
MRMGLWCETKTDLLRGGKSEEIEKSKDDFVHFESTRLFTAQQVLQSSESLPTVQLLKAISSPAAKLNFPLKLFTHSRAIKACLMPRKGRIDLIRLFMKLKSSQLQPPASRI